MLVINSSVYPFLPLQRYKASALAAVWSSLFVQISSSRVRFAHPEQSIAIVTLLGGVYRIAERAGRSRAIEWALSSEQVSAVTMERYGVINRVVPNATLIEEATAFVRKLAAGPTRAHAAHKALLRIWAVGGLAAADEAIWDIALPLFESEDTKLAIPASARALREGRPRPQFPFKGN